LINTSVSIAQTVNRVVPLGFFVAISSPPCVSQTTAFEAAKCKATSIADF
jgi:hypothetical protein